MFSQDRHAVWVLFLLLLPISLFLGTAVYGKDSAECSTFLDYDLNLSYDEFKQKYQSKISSVSQSDDGTKRNIYVYYPKERERDEVNDYIEFHKIESGRWIITELGQFNGTYSIASFKRALEKKTGRTIRLKEQINPDGGNSYSLEVPYCKGQVTAQTYYATFGRSTSENSDLFFGVVKYENLEWQRWQESLGERKLATQREERKKVLNKEPKL